MIHLQIVEHHFGAIIDISPQQWPSQAWKANWKKQLELLCTLAAGDTILDIFRGILTSYSPPTAWREA